MESLSLGRTGIRPGRVGLGTVKLGRNQDVKYPTAFSLPSDREVEALLESALAAGVRFFDTAPAYGSSELRLAPFVRRHRDQIVLCTKAGETFGPDGSAYDFSGEAIRRSLERSLTRLGTDHVELLLLHSDGRDEWILAQTDALETLARLKEEGSVQAIGISAKTEAGIRLGAQTLDVIMAPYSLGYPTLGAEMQHAALAGCGVLAIKALSSGHLAATGAPAALRHVFSQDWIDAVVIGTLDPVHLGEAVRIAAECAR